MKKCLLLLGLLLATAIVCPAQKKEKAVNIFEEAGTRDKEPAFQVFVMPQIADVQFLSTEKETFGPYTFPFKGELTEGGLDNFQGRAVYRAMQESDADVIVAMVPHSYISETDENVLYVEISGYPAKYVNFRPLGKNPDDFEMIRTVYPNAHAVSETKIITMGGTTQNSNKNSNKTATK